MLLRYYSRFDGQPMIADIQGTTVRIGRHSDNDIVLKNHFVDDFAATLRFAEGQWEATALGFNGLEIDGQHFEKDETVAWTGQTSLSIFPYELHRHDDRQETRTVTRRYDTEIHELVRRVHLDMLQELHLNASAEDIPSTTEALLRIERAIERSAAHRGIIHANHTELSSELAGHCVRDELLKLLLDRESYRMDSVLTLNEDWAVFATSVPKREEELNRLTLTAAKRLFEGLDHDQLENRIGRIENEFWNHWDRQKNSLTQALREYLSMRHLKKQLKDTLFGFGPLEDLLRIPIISEIMVNAKDEIFIEKGGVLQNSGRQFVSDDVTLTVIERIVGRVGRRIDTAQPMVDARLPDGSRVNAIIPPLAVKGPCLTIRKFSRQQFTMQKLVSMDSITAQAAEFLEACVRSHRSILVSGGTGTGKTTLLNLLSQAIPMQERIICIEDTHELQLDHPHVVFVECRDGNNEGKGKVIIRDLLKNALRQRPDRLIVGECRGDEALDMLQAMNTGHDGSMTTIHANSPPDALRRLEVLVRHSGLPSDAIRQQIVSAIDVVVQLTRGQDGRRYVSQVSEVVDFDPAKNLIRLRDLFVTSSEYQDHRLAPTGSLPTFAGEIIRGGGFHLHRFLEGVDVDTEAQQTEGDANSERDPTDLLTTEAI